jgi:predicted metal-binding protein
MAFVGAQGLIEEYEEQGVPVVVFCVHKGPVEQIGAREGWTYITGDIDAMERNRRVLDFQAGKYKGQQI